MAFCYTRINQVSFLNDFTVIIIFFFYSLNKYFFSKIRVCKPGGYIEFTEPELATETGPILTRFYDACKLKKKKKKQRNNFLKYFINYFYSFFLV
jgi:hypothetical protein